MVSEDKQQIKTSSVNTRQSITTDKTRSRINSDVVRDSIKAQVQTTLPSNSDSTIMDDTVMIMDGVGLMGGQTVIHEMINLSVKPTEPRFNIKIKR